MISDASFIKTNYYTVGLDPRENSTKVSPLVNVFVCPTKYVALWYCIVRAHFFDLPYSK